MNEGYTTAKEIIEKSQRIIDRITECLRWMPEEDERYPVGLSKKELSWLRNLYIIAGAQENTGKVIERELQNTLDKLENVGC